VLGAKVFREEIVQLAVLFVFVPDLRTCVEGYVIANGASSLDRNIAATLGDP